MHLVAEQLRDTEILHLTGSLDDANYASLAGVLATHLRICRQHGAVPQIILECSEVSYIGSVE